MNGIAPSAHSGEVWIAQQTRPAPLSRRERGGGRGSGLSNAPAPLRFAALGGDQVVKSVDLAVEHVEGPFTLDAVLADRCSLARLHRLEEMIAVGAAALIAMRRGY